MPERLALQQSGAVAKDESTAAGPDNLGRWLQSTRAREALPSITHATKQRA